jgi:glucose dehydrogenase
MREGDNLFCASIVALNAKTGQYAWHFQEVHHDIWDYDAASPVVLFDTVIKGQPRKALAEAGRTGWVYILDRTNGKPLIGIAERPRRSLIRSATPRCRNVLNGWRVTTRPVASSRRFGTSPC